MGEHLRLEELGGRRLSLDEQAHLSECPGCRSENTVRVALRTAPAKPPPLLTATVRMQVRQALANSPRPAGWRALWLGSLALALAAGVLPPLGLGLRADWVSLSGVLCASDLMALLFAAMAGLAAAFAPGLTPRLGGPLVLALGAAFSLTLLPGARPTDPPQAEWLSCAAGAIGWSVVPLLIALHSLRRGEALTRGRGFLAALSAGALGMLALFLRCPVGAPSHILLAHLPGWVLLCGLGLVAGAWLRRPVWVPPEQRQAQPPP